MYSVTISPLQDIFAGILSDVSNLFPPDACQEVESLLWELLERQACDACRVMAHAYMLARQDRVPMPADAKRFLDSYVQMGDSREATAQAFRLFLRDCQRLASSWKYAVERAELPTPVTHMLSTMLEATVVTPASWRAQSYGELILQVIFVWRATAACVREAGELLHAAGLRVFGHAAELVCAIPHYDGNYYAALAEILLNPQGTDLHSLRRQFREALNRERRLDRNPGGTGRKREREMADTELLLSEDDRLPSERLVTAEDPLRHVCRQETFEQIQRMVTPREWQVTELHLLHGYTFKEIAEMLGITTSSASTMYYRFCEKVGADPNRLKEFFSETS